MRSFEIFVPYPTDTVMTDEAVSGMVGRVTKVTLDGESDVPAKIIDAKNQPNAKGFQLVIEEVEMVRHNIFAENES